MENKLLDVHAIHYILAKTKNYSTLFLELNKILNKKKIIKKNFTLTLQIIL